MNAVINHHGLLGTMSDRKAGILLGICPKYARRLRLRLGIPSHRRYTKPDEIRKRRTKIKRWAVRHDVMFTTVEFAAAWNLSRTTAMEWLEDAAAHSAVAVLERGKATGGPTLWIAP